MSHHGSHHNSGHSNGHGSHHGHGESHGHELGHIIPVPVYALVFGILVFLTIVTVIVSRFDFGVFNIVVSMGIASMKALLVALFFMHLKYENPITWLYAMFPIVLLATLIGGVFMDNPFRSRPQPFVLVSPEIPPPAH